MDLTGLKVGGELYDNISYLLEFEGFCQGILPCYIYGVNFLGKSAGSGSFRLL